VVTTGPAVEVTGLRVDYAGRTALRDVTLVVPGGAITAVVGPSGCGKTSFLYALNRMHDLNARAVVRGRIRVGALEVSGADTDVLAVRRRVGLIFQRPNPFPMSVYRNVAMPLAEHGLRGRAALEARVEQALRDVGLYAEVRGELDHRATARIEDLLRALRGRYTLVVVTHNLAQARRVSDRLACFWSEDGAGSLLEEGPTAAMFERPAHPAVWDYLTGHVG
jgi:phosphate transport system ATP-binding protein